MPREQRLGWGGGFGWLWGSQASSNLADGLLAAAAPLLAVTLTRDPVLVSGLIVAQYLPWLVFTLPAGALTDHFDRRLILWSGNLLRAAGFALLALCLAGGWRHIVLLYLAVLLAGAAETLVDNAALTVPPRVVHSDHLERANGRLFATQSVINTFVGPPLGAALFAVSAVLVFWTTAGVFALAALLAVNLPRMFPRMEEAGHRDRTTPVTVVRNIAAGWTQFWGHRLLRNVAFISASINLFGAVTGGVLVLLVTGPVGVPSAWYGVFIGVPATGAILGSLVADRVIRTVGGGPITWAAALAPAASYGVLGLTHSGVLAAAAMFVAAVATACNQIVVSTLRQASVPDRLLGRVTSAYRLVVLGVVPFGALAGGLLATWLGIRAPFLISAGGLLLAALLFARPVTTAALTSARTSIAASESGNSGRDKHSLSD